ncbi:hypothetical protein F4780DRAFT_571685 [Xylariomycetidae sp. FL0641]|nr:hypothetical protein F4780DRAFT_571685 [Xylariomycetidae sp. FL0641]
MQPAHQVTLHPPEYEYTATWCCDGGRLVALWMLACGRPSTKPKDTGKAKAVAGNAVESEASPSTKDTSSQSKGRVATAVAKGVGYGSDRGFAGLAAHVMHPLLHLGHNRPAPPPKPPAAVKAADTKPWIGDGLHLQLMARLLPSHEKSGSLDVAPPELLKFILSRTPLLHQSAQLLGRNAIEELSRSHYLWDGVLNFVDALGSHTATAFLVYEERSILYPKGGMLLDLSFEKGTSKPRITPKDTGVSFVTLIQSLATQARTLRRHAEVNPTEFDNPEGRQHLALSRRLTDMSALYDANKQQFRRSMDITPEEGSAPALEVKEWHRENCVSDVPDEVILADHTYVKQANTAAMGPVPRGRMKRLITEISTLQTSLPEGIYVRHGSSRLDVMKVLIIGPRGTPYEHGCFEFDLFCNSEYPTIPPHMRFRTTAGGKIRFNPNLYENGKSKLTRRPESPGPCRSFGIYLLISFFSTVCLSLLGTWSGEPWRSEQSTILQILVSIQSMILCEEPWYNEPGRELREEKAQSTHYSNEVRSWTLDHAIQPWVAAPEDRTSVWHHTVQLHLRAHARELADSYTKAARRSRLPCFQSSMGRALAALQSNGYLDGYKAN